MNERLKTFIRVALHAEEIGDLGTAKEVALHPSAAARGELEDALKELIDNRSLGLRDWCVMTDVDFETVDDLYVFLAELYRFIYNDGPPPCLPD